MENSSGFNKVKYHPNYYEIEKNIWVIKNFITNEQADILTSFAESMPEEKWWEVNNGEWWHGKFLAIDGDINIYTANIIKSNIIDLIGNNYFIGNVASIHRIQPGQGMFEHKDELVQTAFTMYLNDFDGGEIYYPSLGIEYKPNKGDLLIHPGSKILYTHGVRPVTGNKTRYVTNTAIYDPEFEKSRKLGSAFFKSLMQ